MPLKTLGPIGPRAVGERVLATHLPNNLAALLPKLIDYFSSLISINSFLITRNF